MPPASLRDILIAVAFVAFVVVTVVNVLGFSYLLAFAGGAATRGRWRWLLLAHPVLTLLVVVGTGNHYWLDAVVAITLLGLAALLHPVVVPASATAWGRMGAVGASAVQPK